MAETETITALEWVRTHWAELLTALGIGGSSGIVGKKMLDKEQNKKIAALENRVLKVENGLEINEQRDKDFRKSFDEHKDDVKDALKEIKEGQNTILKYLLDKK